MTIKCLFCGEHVEQFDITAGGADSQGSKGAAGTFDHPAQIECACGAEYADGDLVLLPSETISNHKASISKLLSHYTVLAALSKLIVRID